MQNHVCLTSSKILYDHVSLYYKDVSMYYKDVSMYYKDVSMYSLNSLFELNINTRIHSNQSAEG